MPSITDLLGAEVHIIFEGRVTQEGKPSFFLAHSLNIATIENLLTLGMVEMATSIVNRGHWLGSPANIKGANKDAKIYVGRSTTLHNLLFYTHTLYMSYVTNTFLLVMCSVRSKQLLCFVQGQGQKSEQ